jgi:hypothetical protein
VFIYVRLHMRPLFVLSQAVRLSWRLQHPPVLGRAGRAVLRVANGMLRNEEDPTQNVDNEEDSTSNIDMEVGRHGEGTWR